MRKSTNLFELYPNPAVDQVRMVFAANAERSQVDIFDLTGKLVLTRNFAVNRGLSTLDMDISALESGVYFISLTSGSERVTQKLVVQ